MQAPTIPRRVWLIASTVAVIGGFFAYYFFVYMETQREELEAKKFRALAQYADNIKSAYAEGTKKIFKKYESSVECDPIKEESKPCVPPAELKEARRKVFQPTITQSDFSELVFQVDGDVEDQTFRNNIDESVIHRVLTTDRAQDKRQVEFTINDTQYVIFIHSYELGGKSSRIIGFCDKDQFESQVRAVDLKYVVVASLALILILLMMPLLKLLIMNESEKLHMMNVWFCGFSLVVGSSFLLLVVLLASDFSESYSSFNNYHEAENTGMSSEDRLLRYDRIIALTREERIKKLAANIDARLIREFRAIYDQIKESKSNVYESAVSTCDPNCSVALYPFALTESIQFCKYPLFNEMLWIKYDGSQDTVISTHGLECDELVNLNTRKYFKQALFQDSTWSMPDSDLRTQRFALQSIHSYLTDRHEAGFGTIRNQSYPGFGAIAIATKLHSIMDPLLPPGYQFVIVDPLGKVWFHSRTEKNLNENFIDETGGDGRLVAAIAGKSEAIISLNYDRSNHRAFIRPIRNTGLTLIVLHDDDFFNTPIVLTVGFAFILVTLLFLIQGLHQLILLTSLYRFSLLKVKRFFLSWLRPDEENRIVYKRAVWLHFILVIPLIIIAVFNDSLAVVTFFLALPVYLTIYHYYVIKYKRPAKEPFGEGKRTWLNPFFIASCLLVLFVNISGLYLFGYNGIGVSISAQFIVILILLFFYRWSVLRRFTSPLMSTVEFVIEVLCTHISSIFSPFRLDKQRGTFVKNYYMFLFLWLILASIFPTYYFYKVGYYEEGKVWIRFLHLLAAREQEARDIELNNEFLGVFGDRVKEISLMGNYLSTTDEILTVGLYGGRPPETKSDQIHNLMFNIVPPLTGVAEESRAAIFPVAGDVTWVSRSVDDSIEMEYYTAQRERRFYRSDLLDYQVLKGDYWPLFLMTFVLGIVLLYRTLRFCVTHIFGIGLLQGDRYKVPQLSADAKYFIVGLPRSGKRKLVEFIQGKKYSKENVLIVDLNDEKPLVVKPYCKMIVGTGFHRNLNDHESNQKKLKRMEALLKNNAVVFLVVSNIDPLAIIEFYDKISIPSKDEKGDPAHTEEMKKYKQACLSWHHVLGKFSIHYHRLKEQLEIDDKYFRDKYIRAELDHGEFLPLVRHQLQTPIKSFQDLEKMVLQVEDLSQTYYRAIWNCLSTSEKFLLHDLSKDRFVNMRNMKAIRALRQKGLMIGKYSLQIMNKSFNNFILSIVEEDVDVKMEQQIRQKGSWNTVHLILVITIISIIVFLGLAQQELFKNFQAILAATTALLPLLARFGGIFTGSKSKE